MYKKLYKILDSMKKLITYSFKLPAILIILFLFSLNVFAQSSLIQKGMPIIDPPMINYINVNPNNSINIAWDSVTDSLNILQNYSVFYSDNIDSAFQLLGDTTITTYQHYPTNNYHKPLYYYVLPNVVGGVPIDTIAQLIDTASSIYLNAYKINDSSAVLNWNYVVPHSIASALNYYKIYRRKRNGSWALIDSTQQNSYVDPVSACGDTIYYKIGINIVTSLGYSNQESFSNVSGDYFDDHYPPSMSIIDTIIFDLQTGDAYLYWFPNPSQDLDLYVIYKKINQIITPIDTLFGQNNLSYIDTTNSPSNIPNILDYAIAAADTCGNISSFYWYIGIENNRSEFTLKVYPNPAKETLYFSINSEMSINGIVEIYDVFGKKLIIKNISQNSFNIDISNLANGFYFYKLINNEASVKSGSFIKY